jgi:hypothetical protein
MGACGSHAVPTRGIDEGWQQHGNEWFASLICKRFANRARVSSTVEIQTNTVVEALMTLFLILTGLFGPCAGEPGTQGPFLTGFEVAAPAGEPGTQGPFLTGFEVAAPAGDRTQGPSLTGLLR